MLERPPTSRPDESATQLFAEYLAARDSGESLDLDALCVRAGTNAEELRRRIRALSVLDDLGDALRDDDDQAEDAQAATTGAAVIPRLGPYENLRLLGEGGLSRVYVAYDPGLQREVALKVIANEQIPRGAAHDWMLREGRSVARLEHPNVVRIFALGQTDDALRTYVAMELVDGPSLADVRDELRARKRGGAPVSTDPRVRAAADRYAGIGARAALALRIARALAACHAADVLHRDVKPGNVLLDPAGEPKLIDFGLAHLSEDGAGSQHVTQRLIGTPAYIAPEQVESGMTGADPRSDQFSFGVLLYELLALEAPFQRGTRTQTLDAVARALPVAPREHDPAIPADLETICLHALERDPDDRYPSMDALADDLEAFLDHRAIAISGPGVGRRFELWARRHRRDIAMLGVPTLALALAVFVTSWVQLRGIHAAIEREVAERTAQLDAAQDPSSIQRAFAATSELEKRAADADASILTGALVPAARPRVDELMHAVSHALAVQLVQARTGLSMRYPPGSTEQIEEEVLRTWQAALTLDAVLCPTCPENQVDRDRGRIDVPRAREGTALLVERMAPGVGPGVMSLVPLHEPDGLGPGEYRIHWTDPGRGILAEFDVRVGVTTARRELPLAPIDPGLSARFVRIPAGVLEVAGWPRIAYPEFFALPEWLPATLAREREAAVPPPGDAGASGAAAVQDRSSVTNLTPREVREAALRAGARLPTPIEAVALYQCSAKRTADLPVLPPEFGGEHCGGCVQDRDVSILLHDGTPEKSPRAVPVRFDGVYGLKPLAYRLVVSGQPAR